MCTIYFFDLYSDVFIRVQPVMDDATKAYQAELLTEAILCLLSAIACITCIILFFINTKKLSEKIDHLHNVAEKKITQKHIQKKQARIAKLQSKLDELKKDGQ